MANPDETSDLAKQNHRNLRRLVLSMEASFGKLNLLVAICDNPQYRSTLIQNYETELRGKGVQCLQAKVDRSLPSLKQSLLDLQGEQEWSQPCVVTVLGADELLGVRLAGEKSGREKLLFSLQWTREGLREFALPVVLWVTSQIAQQVAQDAPDFWSWRGGVFEFVQPMTWAVPEASDRSPMETFRIYQPEELADPAELAQEIKQLLEIEPTSPLLSSLYHSLGVVYFNRLEQGISIDRLAEQAAGVSALQSAIDRRQEPNDSLLLADSSDYLASSYQSMGQYDRALPFHESALEIRKLELGDRHLSTAAIMGNLAGLYELIGQYDRALPLCESALEIHKSELGDRHPDTATSLNNLAGLYELMGQYDRALPLYESALEIYKSELGDRHPNTATSLNNLAALYKSMSQYDRALPLYESALEIYKSELGDRHPDTATSLNNLALLYSSMGQYNRALPLYESALEIRKSELGDRHPSTATSLNNLAGLYELMGQYDRALPLCESALEIHKSELGDRHPNTALSLNNLAELYRSMGQYDRALPLLESALEIMKSELGDLHPNVASGLNNLAYLYESMGSDSEAGSSYMCAMLICEKLGTDYPITFTVLHNLVNRYFLNSEYPRAGALLTKWLEICYEKLPIDHVEVQKIQSRLADLKKKGLYNPKSTPQKPTNSKAFGVKPKKGKK